MMKSFYITTAISYVNGAPHLGHVYEMISADFIARFQRLKKMSVFFLTGTDEHGQKIQKAAFTHQMNTIDFCNMNAALFQNIADKFYISYNRFIRTTESSHKKGVLFFWELLNKSGDIYLSKYEGWYSQQEELFLNEEDIITKNGLKYNNNTGELLIYTKEPSYFFRLSKYQERLLEFYNQNKEFITPESRMNETISFVQKGLKDISISRTSFDWGIPVPNDKQKHIIYVWLDALTNYITGIGFPEHLSNWPADIHLIGKDVLRFHAIFWPAFLMSANLPLPKKILAHGFLKINGEKMSKSIGNVIAPCDLLKTLDSDSIRYVLLRNIPYGEDGYFNTDIVLERIHSDLSNSFGNLIQRVFSMVYHDNDKKIPKISKKLFTKEDDILYQKAYYAYESIIKLMDQYKIHHVLEKILELINHSNRYVNAQKPWILKKTNHQRFQIVLYVLSDIIRIISILLIPAIPKKSHHILDYLSVKQEERFFQSLFTDNIKSGTIIEMPSPFFPKILTK